MSGKISSSVCVEFSASEEKKLRENIIKTKQAEILALVRGINRSIKMQRTLAQVRFENLTAEYKKLFATNFVPTNAKKAFNDLYSAFEAASSETSHSRAAVDEITYLEARFHCEFEENYKPELIKFLHQKTS